MSSEVPSEVIELAKRICKKSNMIHFKMSAIIYKYKRNKVVIISVGYNYWTRRCNKTITKGKYPYSVHAEINALKGCAPWELYGVSIYIHRENSLLAKPCPKCMATLLKTNISHIHWSNEKS